ncbi:4-(cytidine 5'-diphospho)-2-C-methyl-D-erythritol kinase [Sphingomonas crusticola]|uniref:4-(cytidine 5'-diphospho)-2-C-methyl-D-erythritol kinase n=1 Tax=Sphingomonas crusticola TaxID=1697973 RepID=UPI000E2858B5|nr:4-(cytidine 5'-diphospho)-2-C-methyl-D-erythritol kinase [Sphingomonas crusticola]
MASETAFAKINLALHVRRRDADGYHAIETLFAFAEDGDVLRLTEEPGLAVTGAFAIALDRGDNLVLRAARGFADLTGQGGDVGFLLDKRLPVAAGIGGGSADAAAALRLLCIRHGLDIADPLIARLAASLGADVPACLVSRPMRGEGRGDRLAPIGGISPGQPLLLVNPGLPLATGPVFTAWDGLDRGALNAGDAMDAALSGRNDLETPAISLLPVIGDVLGLLRAQAGTTLVRMSGSGATCFALFEDDTARDQVASAIRRAQPAWWLLASRLR